MIFVQLIGYLVLLALLALGVWHVYQWAQARRDGTPPRKPPESGFTLVEITMVLAAAGIVAVVVLGAIFRHEVHWEHDSKSKDEQTIDAISCSAEARTVGGSCSGEGRDYAGACMRLKGYREKQ